MALCDVLCLIFIMSMQSGGLKYNVNNNFERHDYWECILPPVILYSFYMYVSAFLFEIMSMRYYGGRNVR